MGEPLSGVVDVSEMLCAQALAVVSAALARVQVGVSLEIRYNRDDVRQDLKAWAADRGHQWHEVESGVARISRRQ
jgi:TusA-related sulfurtransferase